ncbi:flavocytochrome c, partial [Streptococcus pluranimalium]
MTAALSAPEAGADVAFFEKIPVIGGQPHKTFGGIKPFEKKFQKNKGNEGKKILFSKKTQKGGKGK